MTESAGIETPESLFPDLPVPGPAVSLTPVGDWLRGRYPPNDGATHWLGKGDDPGCCAGAHSSCTYDSGWREALVSLAAELDELGFTSLAVLAREKADAPGGAL